MDPSIVVLPATLALIGFMLWVALSGWQQRQRIKAIRELGVQLLAKAGSLADLAPLLQSDAGANVLERLISEPPASSAKYRVLRSVQLGVVLMSAAAGLIVVGRFSSVRAHEIGELLSTVGMVMGAVGIGFLLSALAGYWVALRLQLLD